MNIVYYYFKSRCCKELYRACVIKAKIHWYRYDTLHNKWIEMPIPTCDVKEITEKEAFVEML